MSEPFQIHAWDSAVPIEETLSTLHHLVLQGKVRYIGMLYFDYNSNALFNNIQ